MSTLRCRIFGKENGNFHPTLQPMSQFLANSSRIFVGELQERLHMVYAPRTGFTTNIVSFPQDGSAWLNWLVRTHNPADGALVQVPKVAIGFFNADCPMVCLHEKNRLALLHTGYRCLIRQDQKEDGIIETAMKHFNPKQIKVLVFGGIGPCCFVPDLEDEEIYRPIPCQHKDLVESCLSHTAKQSPFGAGQVSVDLNKLIEQLLHMAGVPKKNIQIDRKCTCCATENGQPVFWSHLRYQATIRKGCTLQKPHQQEIDGRSFSLAWLE